MGTASQNSSIYNGSSPSATGRAGPIARPTVRSGARMPIAVRVITFRIKRARKNECGGQLHLRNGKA